MPYPFEAYQYTLLFLKIFLHPSVEVLFDSQIIRFDGLSIPFFVDGMPYNSLCLKVPVVPFQQAETKIWYFDSSRRLFLG